MALQQVRVGDVLELQRRKVEPAASEEYVEIGLRSFGKGSFHKEPITGIELGNKKVYSIEPGDLVISNVFAWEGALAVATDAEHGLIGSHRFMTWTARHDEEIDVRYLWHYFLSDPGMIHLRRASPGSAGRNRTLGITAFENTVIPLPVLPEQQRIAAHLDRIADASLTPSNSGAALEPRVSALRAAVFAQVSRKAPLGDVLKLAERPEPVLPDKIYKMLGVRWYARGLFVRDTIAGNALRAKKVFRVEEGDFVYNRLFAWKGSFAVADRGHAGCYVSNEFPAFLLNSDSIDSGWLGGAIRLPSLANAAGELSTGSTSTSRNRLQVQDLLSIEIPLPPLSNQTRLAQQLDRMVSLERAAERRQQLVHALLPAARNEEFARLT